MKALLATVRRPTGRHRATAVRDWPVGWLPAADPWQDAPLFDPALTRQARIAAQVTCGRPITYRTNGAIR